jgi:hypothetical protein
MRKPLFPIAVALALIFSCLCLTSPAAGQLVLGQYETEAPLATWNVFGTVPAAGLGLGGIRIARAWDASTAATNPALLLSLPRLSGALTGAYSIAALYRFSIVNTGVVTSAENYSAGYLALESGSFSFRFGDWAAGFTAGLLENYQRPDVDLSYSVQGIVRYAIRHEQKGFLRGYTFALSRRAGPRLSLGAGLTLVRGSLDRSLVEEWPADGITISDARSERFDGLVLNAGLHVAISRILSASLAVRVPSSRRADAASLLRYTADGGATDIRIEAEARNRYGQPLVVGAGLDARWSEAWSAVAEAAYFGWSRYDVLYFDEPAARPFVNIVTAAAGVEYSLKGRLGSRSASFPIRLGLAYDPQPMDDPHSAYLSLAFGLGLRWGPLAVDLAGRGGRESGSGRSLKTGRVALTVSWFSHDR